MSLQTEQQAEKKFNDQQAKLFDKQPLATCSESLDYIRNMLRYFCRPT